MSLSSGSSAVKKELAQWYVSLEYSFSNLKIHDSHPKFFHLTITQKSLDQFTFVQNLIY